MGVTPRPSYGYQVGGSLVVDAPTYVRRQADQDLYESLKRGDFCYILNSRQMGKSSLRVQTMQRLQLEGVACAAIDITEIGTEDITPEQWYAGIIDSLVNSFDLYTTFDLNDWWVENELLSPIQKLSKFIDTVLLKEIISNIVIFIDEIDSILNLKFPLDDFFAVIRNFYNRRADQKEYNRLTFALIGVSTPSDLIKDKRRTPFNIGHAIDLTGFQLAEAQPLAEGLAAVGDRQELLKVILDWTGGQPFLTQKLCKLVVECGKEKEEECSIAHWVEEVVRSRIIDNWEVHDEPEHLKTIRDRILRRNRQSSGRLLGLCQQILQQGEVVADNSAEQEELSLTGLVVRRDGKLRIYNRLYAEVFNLRWCEGELAKLRPYAGLLNDWVDSQRLDESRLLRGKALEDAQAWAADKSLTDLDYQFLDASQQLKTREIERKFELEIAKQKVAAQKQITRNVIAIASISITLISITTIIALIQWKQADKQQIQALTTSANAKYISNRNTFDALIDALRAARRLKESIWYGNDTVLQKQITDVLGNAVYGVRESNILEGHQGYVMQARFSPDGKLIATASYDNTVKLWNSDGKEILTIPHTSQLIDVSFSPDGQIIATASRDGVTRLWNLQGKLLVPLKGHKNDVLSVRFSRDGKIIATASTDKTVKLWSLNGRLLKTLNGHSASVFDISFSRDGKIATASADKKVNLWDAQGKLIKTMNEHQASVLNVNFSPDDKTLVSVDKDGTFISWNLEKTQLLTQRLIHPAKLSTVAFSPDGEIIATATQDGTIRLWSSRDSTLLETLNGHKGGVTSLTFNPQGNILASTSYDKTVKLWQLNDWLTNLSGHKEAILAVDINPKGYIIATASRDKTVKLWNFQGKQLKTLVGHTQAINSIVFSPDGQMIVSGSDDYTVRRWNLQGQELTPPLIGHKKYVIGVAVSKDNNTIASTSLDGTVKLWTRQGKLLKTLTGKITKGSSVSFSPNGKIIAAASRGTGTVQLWNGDGSSLRDWKGHNASIYNVRFSPDGRVIATASEDNTVKLWNLDGREIKPLTGHTAAIWGLDFSPNGKMIATGSDDGTVKIWSDGGVPLLTITGDRAPFNAVKFSPDSKILAIASSNRTATLLNIDNLSLETFTLRGCSWLRNYLKNNPKAPIDICK
ncbi:AAA-like domain-containing protein [Nostoc sp. MS1]|uniref:WD40 domain-containing protein n=1 Tax=Nostoc sp. MS1 TaxID=2764711 RepID=UPI001CC6223F|nr:AAA-like domain-containing protein [Nostoc sp. MS1]BCL37795.1 hypothetical protein NSMS1_42420 [Nostoc sp. MS1]